MSLSTLNSYANSDKVLPLANIRGTIIPTLINQLSKAKESLSDNHDDFAKDMATQIEKLRKDLIYIGQTFTGLENFEESASDLFKILLQPQHSLDQLLDSPKQTHIHDSKAKTIQQYKLQVLSKIIVKLKILIPTQHKMLLNKATPLVLTGIGKEPHNLPELHFSKVFDNSPAFKDFRVVYNTLGVNTKLCLLCFAAFPMNEVIKKRTLVHWWIGEGFLDPPVDEENRVYEIADGIFEELTKKGCIEPVKEKCRLFVHSYKMHPLIRSAVIVIAKEVGFFDFDDKGNPTANFSQPYRACLVNGASHLMARSPDSAPKKLQTVFNVNESYPDFSKVEWSLLRNLKVLYLGRWHSRAKHHIEVDENELLRGVIHMRHLRTFSLRGISRIMELPDSVCKLVSLRILDLGACPNLELLPERIGSLKNLTHLDMSECYLLEYMPKGIALLSQLEVLKGFVIADRYKNDTSCTLDDLSALLKLRKLTINTSRVNFPTEEELIVLEQFVLLRKLTIAWGWLSSQAITLDKRIKQNNVAAGQATPTGNKNHTLRRLPTFKPTTRSTTNTMNEEHFKKLDLDKLDLQCYPKATAPSWLRPGKLKRLKKLYIRGGQLRNLIPVGEKDKWAVEILRLKFLCELEMDWEEIRESFPDLFYLQKFRCPKLTFFPCNESGVWLKPGN